MKSRTFFKILSLIVILASSGSTNGQTVPGSKLKVGDQIPDIKLEIILNSNVQNGNLSDYRGKVIILDYWNKWCASCIEAFPKLELLQNKFKDQLVILPVSFLHKTKVVKDFLVEQNQRRQRLTLPFVVFENTKNTLFQNLPTLGYPHCIWISATGKILKISSTDFITEENIIRALKDEALIMPEKNFQMDFNASKPLLINGNGAPDSAFLYRSLITNSIDSINFALNTAVTDRYKRIYAFNNPAIELIKYSLYRGIATDAFNKLVVFEDKEYKKSSLGNIKKQKVLDSQRLFCYDLTLPKHFSNENLYDMMHQDIDRFFNVKSYWENRPVKCLLLRRIDSFDHLKSRSKKPEISFNHSRLVIKKQYITSLTGMLTTFDSPLIIDESNYKNFIDIELTISPKFNINELNKQLRFYGLKLFEDRKYYNVIVVNQ